MASAKILIFLSKRSYCVWGLSQNIVAFRMTINVLILTILQIFCFPDFKVQRKEKIPKHLTNKGVIVAGEASESESESEGNVSSPNYSSPAVIL